ncbi:MAG: hypothetical protein CMJ18_28105 [Phycisphaeraceae bacterium]|nr:hypothetical protein [Phycisphaeraceae bacterium]
MNHPSNATHCSRRPLLIALLLAAPATGLQADDDVKQAEGEAEAIYTTRELSEHARRPSGERRLYHWPALRGLPYTTANFEERPDGDITEQRAFYWGRVIGSNGVAVSIRTFTENAGDNQAARPFVDSEEERTALTDRLRRFQKLYARHGCAENTMTFYMDAPRKGESPDEFLDNVSKYVAERAALARSAGIPRMMIDMEWTHLDVLKERMSPHEITQFARRMARRAMRALVETYPEVTMGFYPGLTGIQYNIENRINAKGLRHNTRTAFVQGLYDHCPEDRRLFLFAGWTYSATDQCTGTKWWTIRKSPFVHDTDDAIERIIYAHEQLLGPRIDFEWGRWELGGHRYNKPGVPGLAMIKLSNVPLAALERTWNKLYGKSDVVFVWDHFDSWDEGGYLYVKLENDEETAGYDKWLAEIDPAYHKLYDAVTGEYWIPGTPGSGWHGTKRDMFDFHTRDGITHVVGRLDPNFAQYVNLTKEIAGRDRDVIPLYNDEHVRLAEQYGERGFFPYQKIERVEDSEVAAYLAPVKKTKSGLGHELK